MFLLMEELKNVSKLLLLLKLMLNANTARFVRGAPAPRCTNTRGRWEGALACHAGGSSPRHWAGNWDSATEVTDRGASLSFAKCTCSQSGNYWARVFPTRMHWFIPSSPCVSAQQKVSRLITGPGAVWQLQRGPSCSPIYPAESEVCLALTFQNQEGSSITAALSGLPCHPLFPADAVGDRNPTMSTSQDSVMGRSFFLCHINITAETENGHISLLQRSIITILVTPSTFFHVQRFCTSLVLFSLAEIRSARSVTQNRSCLKDQFSIYYSLFCSDGNIN